MPNFITLLRKNEENVNFCSPTSTELYEVITRLKNGKASNDIPIVFIKSALHSKEFLSEMTVLYKEIWETLEIPTSWSHYKSLAIWKGKSKGACGDLTTYRG